jgi:hypothetical protein
MLLLGALPFAVEPDALRSSSERDLLARLDTPGGDSTESAFRCSLSLVPPWTDADPGLFPKRSAAIVRCTGATLRISHHDFVAEIDPARGAAALYRRTEQAFPLGLTLRVALTSRLPVLGGVPLHAAGIVVDGSGVVFYGPSGAGKSTLAATSPHPVLSDELVAVRAMPAGFGLAATGVWGTLDRGGVPVGVFPLKALVELAKGPGFRLDPLSHAEAFRSLTGVTMVPASPALWSAGLGVLNRLVGELPVFRMSWSPLQPPWHALADALARA